MLLRYSFCMKTNKERIITCAQETAKNNQGERSLSQFLCYWSQGCCYVGGFCKRQCIKFQESGWETVCRVWRRKAKGRFCKTASPETPKYIRLPLSRCLFALNVTNKEHARWHVSLRPVPRRCDMLKTKTVPRIKRSKREKRVKTAGLPLEVSSA